MLKLEIKDEAEAEVLISQNLTCHITGIIYNVEEMRYLISVQQCWMAKVSVIWQQHVNLKPNF